MVTSEITSEFFNKKDNKHGRYIHDDGGNILTMYIRIFGGKKTRLFTSINMFQCDKCSEFFAMVDGTSNLVPLLVVRKDIDIVSQLLKDLKKENGDRK